MKNSQKWHGHKRTRSNSEKVSNGIADSPNKPDSKMTHSSDLSTIHKLGPKVLFCALLIGVFQTALTYSKKSSSVPNATPIDQLPRQHLENAAGQAVPAVQERPGHDTKACVTGPAGQDHLLLPTVYIGVPVRNKAHSLPYFLRGIEIQDYPTDRIHISFFVDNSLDDSDSILHDWALGCQDRYHSVDIQETKTPAEVSNAQLWSEQHYRNLIDLRQQLLARARQSWADFYFSIDADVILVNPETLRHLVNISVNASLTGEHVGLPVVAPLLNCSSSEFYSNFWGAIKENGYYERSDNYFDIIYRHIRGVFPVPLVHTAFLINLRLVSTKQLAYFQPPDEDTQEGQSTEHPSTPIDDLVVFARSAQLANVSFFIDNTLDFFGYFHAPVEVSEFDAELDWNQQWHERDQEMFTHLRLQAIVDIGNESRLLPSDRLTGMASRQLPPRSKHGLSEIYYINLERRTDRRDIMEYVLDQLGIDAIHVPAVDGQGLNGELLKDMGVRQLAGYADPYHKRSLKFGEIGCFLSHYALWQEMVDRSYEKILVLEDDLRFAPGFQRNLKDILFEADTHQPDWDLLYIGRKRMSKKEKRVPNTYKLAYPDYTYWTLGYILKLSGAEKLLAQKPLGKMVAVDEYLPIMFNRHPQNEWLEQFEPRNLVALSAEPLLVEPQRYTGEDGYVSDTEDSTIVEVF